MIHALRTNDTTKVISFHQQVREAESSTTQVRAHSLTQQPSAKTAITLPPPYVQGYSMSTPLLLAGEKKQ